MRSNTLTRVSNNPGAVQGLCKPVQRIEDFRTMSSFTYLLASLAFVTLFGLLFLCRPDGRRAMWSTGLTMAPMGPLSQYWHM